MPAGTTYLVGLQGTQYPNPDTPIGSTLVLNNDPTYTIDLAPNSSFEITSTFTLDAQEAYNWPNDIPLWIRISPSQGNAVTGIDVWIQPGGSAAPPKNISVSQSVNNINNATSIQGFPISPQAPNTGQGLVWDGSEWIPENIVNSIAASTGIAITGPSGNVTIQNSGVISLTAGAGIGVNVPSGNPTITNNGVTGINAGSGISINQSTGVVTISSTGGGASNWYASFLSGNQTASNTNFGLVSGVNVTVSPGTYLILGILIGVSNATNSVFQAAASLSNSSMSQPNFQMSNQVTTATGVGEYVSTSYGIGAFSGSQNIYLAYSANNGSGVITFQGGIQGAFSMAKTTLIVVPV